MKKVFNFLLILCSMNACKSEGQYSTVSGKMIVCERPSAEGKCCLFTKNEKKSFYLPNTNNLKYDIQSWLNKKDILVVIEINKALNRKTTHSNLVLLDTSGKIKERIIDNEEGNYIVLAYPSPLDKYILFASEFESQGDDALELFKRRVTLNIFDFTKKEIIRQIPDFCPNINFDMHQSPWSPDEERFVYSIRSDRKVCEEGKLNGFEIKPSDGIYIYNIQTNKHIKVADKGYYAIWSPFGDQIAFINDNTIWLYHLSTDKKELLYEVMNNEQVKIIRWTPDGNYLYANTMKDEKLIRLKDKKVVKLENIYIGFNNFFWKGD